MEKEHHRGHESTSEGPRFSEGQEDEGESHEKEHRGDFAEGQEHY